MKSMFKTIFTLVIITFIGYVVYRNMLLSTIPSVGLIKDEKTMSMYNNIMPNTSNNNWKNLYFSEKSVTVKNIPVEMKYNIAFKNLGTGESSISEDRIKKSYEKLFGNGSYQRIASFQGGCNTYNYINSRKTYEKNQNIRCENTGMSILSRIVDAKQKDDYMSIDVVIAYINKEEKIVYKNCNMNMSKCTDILEKDFTNFDEANLLSIKNKLNRYTFVYKLINEEYYFDSVKKTK